MNQYRCETCTFHTIPIDEIDRCKGEPITIGEFEAYQKRGCASHSDFQSEQLTENQKNTRLLREATHDYKIRRDAQDKVLDKLHKKARSRANSTTKSSSQVYQMVKGWIVELRQAGEP